MENLIKALREEIALEAKKAVMEIVAPNVMFADLPCTALTSADVMRVFNIKKDALSTMIRDGFPHTHTGEERGTEYRFFKCEIIEWRNGKVFECRTCERKKQAKTKSGIIESGENLNEVLTKQTAQPSNVTQMRSKIAERTTEKLKRALS